MSARQREHFRVILQRKQLELIQEVDRTMDHMQGEITNLPDPTDQASQAEEFGIVLKMRERERHLFLKIAQALRRIESEDYGYCETCGAEIRLARLEARPEASECIDCKTLSERQEKQLLG